MIDQWTYEAMRAINKVKAFNVYQIMLLMEAEEVPSKEMNGTRR